MIVWPPPTWQASKESQTDRISGRTFLNGWKSVWDKWSSWLTQSSVKVVDFQCGFFYSSSRRSFAQRADQKTEAKEIWASVNFSVIFPNFLNMYIQSVEEFPHLSRTLISTFIAEERTETEIWNDGASGCCIQLIFLLVCFNLVLILVISIFTWPTYNCNIYKDSCSLKIAC